MVLGLLCHISFATLFLVTGHMTLVVFNLAFSIPVFGICIREAHKGHSTNAMTLSTVELLAHAWFVSVHIGAETAFFMYPTLLVAIYPMMTWFSVRQRLLASLVPVGFTCVLYSYTREVGINSDLSPFMVDLIASYNFFAYSIALAGITTYYVWAAGNREHELSTEITQYSLSTKAASAQLERITGLATFSQTAAHATSEQTVLDICGRVIHKIASTKTVDLILVDSNSGPFGTFFERVHLDPDLGLKRLETIPEQEALRATIARDQGGVLTYTGGPDHPFWFDDWQEMGCKAGIVVPLIGRGQFLGIIGAASPNITHFSADVCLAFKQFGSALSASISLSRALQDLEVSLDRADNVLLKALPPGIAHRLKKGEDKIADLVECAGIFFCDLAGFTKYSSQLTPHEVVPYSKKFSGCWKMSASPMAWKRSKPSATASWP